MSTPGNDFGDAVWELPPLILHPFSERTAPSTLLENSKAALMLAGIVPGEGATEDELKQRLLNGRFAEVRMLYFVGKDVLRWVAQCAEWAARNAGLAAAEMAPQSFAGLLTARPPQGVKEKLMRWGVADHSSVFARAIGIYAIFAQPPGAGTLSEEFLRSYHRYADALFRCYMESQPHALIDARNFRFELYASGEYARLLESEWGEPER